MIKLYAPHLLLSFCVCANFIEIIKAFHFGTSGAVRVPSMTMTCGSRSNMLVSKFIGAALGVSAIVTGPTAYATADSGFGNQGKI